MNQQNPQEAYARVLRALEAQRRALREAGADPDFLTAFEAIIRHLSHRSHSDVAQILAGSRTSALRLANLAQAPKMASLSLDEVEHLVRQEQAPRSVLEAIAVGRFQVPRGSLRSLGKAELLREKILTMVRNERAHQTIADVARGTARNNQ